MLALAIPLVDEVLADPAELAVMIDQYEKVFGRERIAQLCYQTLCIKRPDLTNRRIIGRAIRRGFGV